MKFLPLRAGDGNVPAALETSVAPCRPTGHPGEGRCDAGNQLELLAGADVNCVLALLPPLRADLVTLQECSRPDGNEAAVFWRGTNPRQGVAVAVTQAGLRLKSVEIPSLHPTVVPVVVHAPRPFMFVGVWTHPPYNAVAWAAMTAAPVPDPPALRSSPRRVPAGS